MNQVMVLAKVFSKLKYAEDFVNYGKFRLNTIRFFKDLNEEHENNISDQNEGLIFRFLKNHEATVTIKVGDHTEDLDFESVCAHSDYILNNKIFCMYAPSCESDKELPLEAFHEIISMQDGTDNLGSYLVLITNRQIFNERLIAEIKRLKYGLRGDLIEYKDFSQPVQVDKEKVGFVKSDKYSHQKEYRFMVDDGKNENIPLDLEIGSLKDITLFIPIEDFNESFKVVPKDEISNYIIK